MTISIPWRNGVLILLSLAAPCLFAQQDKAPAAGPAPPKNLKLLPANDQLNDVMRGFNEALGVQCNYCHVAGDFASDASPHKETARSMIALVRQIDPYFPSGGSPFPRGYHEVDCMTCHRGSVKPETKAAFHFINLREAKSPPADTDPGTNLKVLPANTRVHGTFSIMEEFRDALNVDCAYCHGGSGGFAADANPRKDMSRRMIELTKSVNANFPSTGVYPEGKQAVTCYTCHRGDPHPASLSNRRYDGPIPPVP